MAATVNLKDFPHPQQVECPSCLKSITHYDPLGSEFTVCPKCNSYLHYTRLLKFEIKGHAPALSYIPALPLGAEGTVFGFAYKVIGYMEKKEGHTEYEWREYMLYNYEKGYAFLAEYNGNWSYIAGIQYYPDLDKVMDYTETVGYEDNEFDLFNKYQPVITGLAGEYDWDVLAERVAATEYIIPPVMIVKERDVHTGQIDFYRGTYIAAADVAAAFNVTMENFPEKGEIGAIEASPYAKRWLDARLIVGGLIVLVILIQLLFIFLRPQKTLLNNSFNFGLQTVSGADSITNSYSGTYEMKSFKTPSFVVDNGPAPLDIGMSSPVDNNWFESTIELVNEQNNQTWDLTKQIEYYHGYEDGENWSEGGQHENVLISGIPEGHYHINVYPYAGASTINEMDITVTENKIQWRNILVTVLVLLIYPIFCWYRMRKFETDRWANSDYSPYKKTTE